MWLSREIGLSVVVAAVVFGCLCLGGPARGMPKGLAAKMKMQDKAAKRGPAAPPADGHPAVRVRPLTVRDRPPAGEARGIRVAAPDRQLDIEVSGHFGGRHWWRAGHARQAVLETRASAWRAGQRALKSDEQQRARGWKARRDNWRLTTEDRTRFGLPAEAWRVQTTGLVRNNTAQAPHNSHRALIRHLFASSTTPNWVQTTLVFDQELTPLGHLAVTTGELAEYYAWLGHKVSRSSGSVAAWFYRPPRPQSPEHSTQRIHGAAGRIAQGTWWRFEVTPRKLVKQTHAFEAGVRDEQHWQQLRDAPFGPVRVPELPRIPTDRPIGLNAAADIIDALGPSAVLEQTVGASLP